MVKEKELKIFCAWGSLPMQFINLLKAGWEEIKEVNSISASDLVIFTGGADVSPSMYHREMMGAIGCDADRDKRELLVYEQAVKKGIPIFGVCRGCQFVWSQQEGGNLYQDVNNHRGAKHLIQLHDGRIIQSDGDHHQMLCLDNVDPMSYELLATSFKPLCTRVVYQKEIAGPKVEIDALKNPVIEVEAVQLLNIPAFLTQFHPEWSEAFSVVRTWTLNRLKKLISENSKLSLTREV